MKNYKIKLVFLAAFLIVVFIYFRGIGVTGNIIIVEKQIDKAGTYEHYNKINDKDKVNEAKRLINTIVWKNVKVDISTPEYRFHFKESSEAGESNNASFSLWVSPNKDKVDLVYEGKSKYIQLNEEKSEKLYEIITGKKLGDL